ncbi:MAG TPA: hypothetical protein VMW48_10670 [Vicinamibacterales bacterium]|nr:hypothetical protein [Vicinamibacterales bacterium]
MATPVKARPRLTPRRQAALAALAVRWVSTRAGSTVREVAEVVNADVRGVTISEPHCNSCLYGLKRLGFAAKGRGRNASWTATRAGVAEARRVTGTGGALTLTAAARERLYTPPPAERSQ